MIRDRLWFMIEMADAWWDYGDPFERIAVGGVLLCLVALNIILLDRVLTDADAQALLINLGPLGEFNVVALVAVMIAWYMIRPGELYWQVRERREVDGRNLSEND